MEGNVCTVIVLFALALGVNSAPADQQGGEASCTLEVPEEKTALTVLQDKSHDCLVEFYYKVTEIPIELANTTAEYQEALQRGCDKEPSFSECVEAVRPEGRLCLDSMNKTMFTLELNHLKFTFGLVCAGDSERMAIISEQSRKTSILSTPDDLYSKCKLDAYRKHGEVQGPYQDPNTHMKREYGVLKDARECMEKHRGHGRDILVDNIISLWSDIIDGMKCVDPQNGTEILCKTIFEN